MEPATRSTVRSISGQVAVIVGVLHLGLGTYYSVGGPGAVAGDPRVLVWVLAGAALVGGVAVAAAGWGDRRLYTLGSAVVGLLVVAHLAWPALGRGSLYLGPVPRAPVTDPVGYLGHQLLAVRPVAKVLLALEVLLLGLLAVLLGDDGPR